MNAPDHSSFEKRLACAMQKANINKLRLSELLGVAPSTISGWFNGKKPTLQNLLSLSGTLNLSLSWLVGGQSNMYLHGPLYLEEDECRLLNSARELPVDYIDTALAFLASLTETDKHTLVERAMAHHALTASRLPMFIDDNDTILHDANPAFMEMLAIPGQEKNRLTGQSILDIIAEEDRSHFVYNNKKSLDGNHNHHFKCRFVRPHDDQAITVAMSRVHHGDKQNGFFFTTLFPAPEPSTGH